jgi:PhzF family phenazine biosynthesis protein
VGRRRRRSAKGVSRRAVGLASGVGIGSPTMLAMVAFAQVDVFSPEAVGGNPLAVVLDAEDLDDVVMQRFAAWTNLSETVFLLPPTDARADYRVRIFTPSRELPFAGHPTLGSAHAWSLANGASERDRFVQECGVGLVELHRVDGRLAFAGPPLVRSGPLDDETLDEFLVTLGINADEVIDHAWTDNGPGWAAVLLADPERVLSLTPGRGTCRMAVVATHSEDVLEVRAFVTQDGYEDSATGSLNAGVAEWLLAAGRMRAPYVARQGTALGRTGRIHISQHEGRIWVGGDTRSVISGTVEL